MEWENVDAPIYCGLEPYVNLDVVDDANGDGRNSAKKSSANFPEN